MKKVKFIYNPSSGEFTIADSLDIIIALYQERGFVIVPFRLDFKTPAEAMLDDIDPTFDHILVAGGDGTINFVVNQMKRRGVELPIAVLPAGTANDFAGAFKIPADVEQAVRVILDGEVRPVDVGVVNGTYFVNICSAGLFTSVSQNTPTPMKNAFGMLAYIAGGALDLVNYHRIRLSVASDGGDFEGDALTLLIFNGRTAGNIKLARMSQLDDGLLDVLIIKGDNPIEAFNSALVHVAGLARESDKMPWGLRGVAHIRCSRLAVKAASHEPTDIDGQPGPDLPLEVWCERGGINLIAPAISTT
ncbi:MAG: YegS/Rv2252/BmrU family lipid kinase [Rikenellaceae bacterium]|jgi:YegS/Rv2252/BmrU family lipid kinase|nr:YegS/Rv2252/BmrU family lipid kinase [Rikenellaceae bacterium]